MTGTAGERRAGSSPLSSTVVPGVADRPYWAHRDPSRGSLAPGQPHPLAGLPDAKPLARRHARHPRDLAAGDHHGQPVTRLARDLAVGEQVLERLGAAEP